MPAFIMLHVIVESVAAGVSPVSPACQAKLNQWCYANCPVWQPHFRNPHTGQNCPGNLTALDSTGSPQVDPKKEWRCYSDSGLDASHMRYINGSCYCSRAKELLAELCHCQHPTDPARCGFPAPPPAAPLPFANSTYTVFNSSFAPAGSRGPVSCYRIPAIEQAADGTLVAMAEARIGKFSPDGKTLLHGSCDDCVVNGIAQRRSTDGGRQWGAYEWAVSDHSTDPSREDMDIGGNPSLVLNKFTGKLVLQFVRGLRNKRTQAQTCNPALTNWQQESSDSGITWSKPREISTDLGPWAGSLVGPSNGIQLTHNKLHKNRLVWCGHWGVYNSTQVWYSDDEGVSYKLSTTVFEYMDECTLAELSDGRVYLNMRNNHRTKCHCRAFATSVDGGASFGALNYDAALPSPVCQATLSTAGDTGALFFANPADGGGGFATARIQGTIKKSLDNGKSESD